MSNMQNLQIQNLGNLQQSDINLGPNVSSQQISYSNLNNLNNQLNINNPGLNINPFSQNMQLQPQVVPMTNFLQNDNSRWINSLMQLLTNDKNSKPFKIPNDATSCLYVDGVPIDAPEREVSHIFRPYPGF